MTDTLQKTGLAVPWDYRRCNQFISLARTRKHVHPGFIADVETLYYDMTATCVAAVEQARADTNEYKTASEHYTLQHYLLESELGTTQNNTQLCRLEYNILGDEIEACEEKNEVCEKEKGDAMTDLRGWKYS